jgi:hypothetical protein
MGVAHDSNLTAELRPNGSCYDETGSTLLTIYHENEGGGFARVPITKGIGRAIDKRSTRDKDILLQKRNGCLCVTICISVKVEVSGVCSGIES